MKYFLMILMLSLASLSTVKAGDYYAGSLVLNNTVQTQSDDVELMKICKQTKYWKRYKVLRACGWTALPVGVATFVVGVNNSGCADGSSDNKLGDALAFTGIGLVVSSVPVLVCAYVNRSKAMKSARLSLQGSVIGESLPMGTQKSHPALSLCLNF